jgi:dihydrolipoamide dehydrogenase
MAAQKYDYDLLVIGAGAAGSGAASTAAQQGARVALVERDTIGGTCLNYGCDPTKTLLHTAALLRRAQHADAYGLHIPVAHANWAAVLAHVHQVLTQIRGGTPEEARAGLAKQGITVLIGEARFISPHAVALSSDLASLSPGKKRTEQENLISAARIIIATGSQAVVPPIEGLREAGFITNVEAVSLPVLPRRLAIIGGGPLGIEFAQMFHRFGVQVTVLENSPHLLDKEDRELANCLCKLLTKEGIRLETSVQVQRVERADGGKRLAIRCGDGVEENLVVDEILLATGRQPVLDPLHLEVAGVAIHEHGIAVDATLRTSVPHIWAAGDVIGGYQFTHVAYEQGRLAARNAFAQEPRPFDDHAIPWVIYTDPALAHVGKTEEQLRAEGRAYQVGRMPFSQVERAIANGETNGLVKLLVDPNGAILGGHILAQNADDLLAPIILAMRTGLPAATIAATILPYPTMSEGVRWAAERIA